MRVLGRTFWGDRGDGSELPFGREGSDRMRNELAVFDRKEKKKKEAQ